LLYVDDTDLVTCAENDSISIQQVTYRMQQMLLCWHGVLRITGGTLGPPKCSWGPISFGWDDSGQWHYRTDVSFDMQIPDSNGVLTTISQLTPSSPVEVVGVWQTIDGDMSHQVQVLQEKATNLGEMIRKGYLPRNLVWQSFRTMIWPSLRYCLPATTLTQEESDDITNGLYKFLLPSSGTNRHFPHVVRHAPLDFFGLDLNRCADHQGTEQIKKLLTHGMIDTPTGNLLRCSLELAQLEVGIGTPFLESDFSVYGCLLTDCWLKRLWEFVYTNDIQLRNPDQVLPKQQRAADEFIMERVAHSQAFTALEMLQVN